MKHTRTFTFALLCAALVFAAAFIYMPQGRTASPDRITVQEILAKHLDSIGPAAARDAVKNRIMLGTASATFRNGGGNLQGKAVMASEGPKSLLSMVFNVSDYPYEAIGFDGKNLTIGSVKGTSTALGGFLFNYDVIVKEGLFGGTLSSAWPLLDASLRGAKLDYEGTKTIDGRLVHKIGYTPKKGGELEITLYFDAKTFQHVRTEYFRRINSQMGGTVDTSARQRELHYKLIEDFSDFKTENSLTLPHTYKMDLSVEGNQSTLYFKWALNLTQFHFNHPIDEQAFRLVQTNTE